MRSYQFYVLVLEVSQNGPDSSKIILEIKDKVYLSSQKRILLIFCLRITPSIQHLLFFLLVTNIF